MKRQTATFLVCLFPLLAPTLVFAHARPHPHPHARGPQLSGLEKLKIKRQLPVLNDTIPIDTTTSSESSSTTTEAPSTTTDLDKVLSSIESEVLSGDRTRTTDTTEADTTTAPNPKNGTSTDDTVTTTTTSEPDTTATTAADTSSDLSTEIPVATFTSGVTTGLNTPSLTVQPAIPMDTSTSSAEEETTTSQVEIPIIDTLSDILTSLLADPTTTTSADPTTTDTEATTTEDPTTTADSETTTEAPSPTSTGLDDILSSILSSVTSDIGDVTTLLPNATDVGTTTTSDVTSVLTSVVETDTPTTTDLTSTTDPTAVDTTLIPTETGTDIISTDVPTNSTTDPTGVVTDISTTTSLPVDATTTTDPSATTGVSIETTGLANSTAIISTDTSATSIPTETSGTLVSTAGESASVTDGNRVASSTAAPSADLDTSSLWFGTSLVTQGTPTASDQSSIASTATSLPSGVPEAITPPGGVPDEPANSTLVQIGFTREYNYAFVSSSLQSAAQICDFLPKGLADGLGVPRDQLKMHTLQPLQPEGLDYIVTLGLVYIPSDVFPKLQTDIHIPLSDLYNNQNPTIKAFMNTIDPSIPLIPGQNVALVSPTNSGGNGGGDSDPSWVQGGDEIVDGSQATSTAGADQADGADPYSTDGGTRNPVTTKTVTIGVASVGAAALYGVAMYFLAKRYRNNRLSHRRSQSLTGGGIEPPPMSDMRSSGALSPMMSTNFFNNGRTTPAGSDKRGSKGSKTSARGQISAPMMSENSLGWD